MDAADEARFWPDLLAARPALSNAAAWLACRPGTDGHGLVWHAPGPAGALGPAPDVFAAVQLDDPVRAGCTVRRRLHAGDARAILAADLEQLGPARLEGAVRLLDRLAQEWLVLRVSTRPSWQEAPRHRTVLPLSAWIDLFQCAGFEPVSRDPAEDRAATPGSALLALHRTRWLRSDPFRQAAHRWQVVFRRRRGLDDEALGALARRLGLQRVVPPHDPRGPRIGVLIGSPQDFHQLRPILESSPPGRALAILRRGSATEEGLARAVAVRARVEALGDPYVDGASTDAPPWSDLDALIVASESTANSDHLLNAAFVATARLRGIPTLQLQHGIVPTADFPAPVVTFTDHYLAWSDRQRALFGGRYRRPGGRVAFAPLGPMQFRVTGWPTLDAYVSGVRPRIADLLGSWTSRYQRTVLVATNLHWSQHRRGEGVLRHITALAAAHPDELFVLKLHPAEPPPDPASMDAPSNVSIVDEVTALACGFESSRLVRASDALVCTLSSIALEAAVARIPFVMLDTGNPNRYTGVRAHPPADLAPRLASMRAARRRAADRSRFVEAYVDPRTIGGATARVADLVRGAASRRARPLDGSSARTLQALAAFGALVVDRDARIGDLETGVAERERYIHSLLAGGRAGGHRSSAS